MPFNPDINFGPKLFQTLHVGKRNANACPGGVAGDRDEKMKAAQRSGVGARRHEVSATRHIQTPPTGPKQTHLRDFKHITKLHIAKLAKTQLANNWEACNLRENCTTAPHSGNASRAARRCQLRSNSVQHYYMQRPQSGQSSADANLLKIDGKCVSYCFSRCTPYSILQHSQTATCKIDGRCSS